MKVLNLYNISIYKFPLITKSITCGFIVGLSDFCCQKIEINIMKKGTSINIKRVLKQASFGFLFAPLLHFHYSKLLPTLFPEGIKYNLAKSVIFTVVVFDGLVNFF